MFLDPAQQLATCNCIFVLNEVGVAFVTLIQSVHTNSDLLLALTQPLSASVELVLDNKNLSTLLISDLGVNSWG